MKNSDNLIPLSNRTKEEQRSIAQKGGIASGKARRRKRTMKEAAQLVLGLPVTGKQDTLLAKYGIDEKDRTNMLLLMIKAVQMATNGDLKAAEFVRDTLGENPRYSIYEKKIQLMLDDKQSTNELVDDWVKAVIKASKP